MSAVVSPVQVESCGDVSIIWTDNPPVNAQSWPVLEGLVSSLQRLLADHTTRGIVLACRGRTFFAGADIQEFGQPRPGVRPDPMREVGYASKPVVAAVFGTTFGAGLELALCCHARVGVPGTRFALPEVKLGLMPGAGGTPRLARLVGVERALDMITSGEPIGAQEALAIGLLDVLVEPEQLIERAVLRARHEADSGILRRPQDLDHHLAAVRDDRDFFTRYRRKIAARTRGTQAPEAIVTCMDVCVHAAFEVACEAEGRAFHQLMESEQSRALRYAFFAERSAAKVPDISRDTALRPVRKVGVISTGTMGGGIATCFANAGIPAIVVERDAAALEALHDCDLVIEAVFENMGLKQELFARLDAICKSGAILASNTSGLDINQLAAVTARTADVIGMHFFSPADGMKLLEVVRGRQTADDVIATTMALAKTIGKVPALVGVCPGFVGTRMLARCKLAAQKLLLQGVTPQDIDRVLYEFGFPMGPLAMSDVAGLDSGSNAAPPLAQFARGTGFAPRPFDDAEILQRCLLTTINEGAKILQEGIAARASDIDVIWVNGYGWPMHRGGPMYYADRLGLPDVVASLHRLAHADDDPLWQPAPLLVALAAEGKSFCG